MDDEAARTHLVSTADQLFYERGIRAVGMDDVRDAAGVSLKRLYRLYPTKEQLVEAALRRRDQDFRRSLASYLAALPAPRDKILGVFDFLQDWFREPGYRGCPFINALAEIGTVSDCVTSAVRDQKQAFADLLAGLTDAAGVPPAVGRQLFVLANGAMVVSAVQRTPEAGADARAAAVLVLEEAEHPRTAAGQ